MRDLFLFVGEGPPTRGMGRFCAKRLAFPGKCRYFARSPWEPTFFSLFVGTLFGSPRRGPNLPDPPLFSLRPKAALTQTKPICSPFPVPALPPAPPPHAPPHPPPAIRTRPDGAGCRRAFPPVAPGAKDHPAFPHPAWRGPGITAGEQKSVNLKINAQQATGNRAWCKRFLLCAPPPENGIIFSPGETPEFHSPGGGGFFLVLFKSKNLPPGIN